MESFLVYLFNFYYAISELEQNKQNNTIIFFLLFIFLTKKWTSAVCGGGGCGRTHRTPPPYGPGQLTALIYIFYYCDNTLGDSQSRLGRQPFYNDCNITPRPSLKKFLAHPLQPKQKEKKTLPGRIINFHGLDKQGIE